MKKIIYPTLMLALLGASACKKEESSNPQTLIEYLRTGSWKVSSYLQGTNDQSLSYMGSSLVFTSSNRINVQYAGLTTYSGAYNLAGTTLNITFDNLLPAAELANDWKVIESSNQYISMIDSTGLSGQVEKLTLSR